MTSDLRGVSRRRGGACRGSTAVGVAAGAGRRLLWLSALAVTLAGAGPMLDAAAAAQPITLIYPKPADTVRWDYALKLVALALKHSGRDYVLQPTSNVITQARAMRELEAGHIDFIWAGTSAEYERRLRPIRIPVLRGLEGYRICITSRQRLPAFAAVNSLSALKQLTIGQGFGWSDTKILEAAGFTVDTAAYDRLFEMVDKDRFDCFLRGIHEAPGEVAEQRARYPDLVVEPHVLVVYPFASFFFVNRNNATLAQDLQRGLERAYDDGSFIALFNSHPAVKNMLARAQLPARQRFDVANPLLTDETRAIARRYWQDQLPEIVKDAAASVQAQPATK